MKRTSRLLATATDAGSSKPFRPAPMALLPPIPLYRRLLRTHRKRLPAEERVLGDMYVKAEWKAHRNIDNPVHIVSLSLLSCSGARISCLRIITINWICETGSMDGV
jgi:hypothetical protein